MAFERLCVLEPRLNCSELFYRYSGIHASPPRGQIRQHQGSAPLAGEGGAGGRAGQGK